MTATPVIIVESGTSGGGSFHSLGQHLAQIDRDRWTPHVVYLNETPHAQRAAALGATVHIARDRIHSNHRSWTARALGRLQRHTDQAAPTIGLKLDERMHRAASQRIETLARRIGARLIVANNQPRRDLFVYRAASNAAVPCIGHLRSHDARGFRAPHRRYANATVSQFIAHSPHAAAFWTALGLDEDRITTVPNPVETPPRPRHSLRDTHPEISDADPLIVHLGNHHRVKGVDLLINAFARTYAQHPRARLVLIGVGPETPRLKKLARARHVPVLFAGYRDDGASLLHDADIVVNPSRDETFGRGVIEAQACGRAVIASAVGPVPTLVTDGETGILVPRNDDAAIATALDRLISDPALRDRLGTRAKANAAARPTKESYSKAVDALWTDAVTGWEAAP